jgi:hypothetical protein
MQTIHEKLEELLKENFPQASPEQIGSGVAKILGMKRGKEDEITHILSPTKHQLIINEVISDPALHTEVIRIDNYIATTDAYMGILPQIGRIYEIKLPHFKQQSAQKDGDLIDKKRLLDKINV